MSEAVPSAPGSAKRSVGVVGASVLVATLLGAVIPIICARLLPVLDYQYFLAFWGLIFGLGSALSCVEQEVSRQSSVATIAGRKLDRSALQVVTTAAVAIGVVGALACIPQISSRLFGPYALLAVLALVGGIAFAFQFGVRGVLIGQGRVGAYGTLIMGEALVRAVLLGVFAFAAVVGVFSLAVAVAAGSFAWLLLVAKVRGSIALEQRGDGLRAAAGRIMLLMVSAGLTASVITGYPALVNLLAPSNDGAAVAGLFAALTVARFPLVLLSPIQALTVPTVVRLSNSDEGRRRLRRLLSVGFGATVVLGAAGAGICAWAGPFVVRLVFGSDYVVAGYVVAGLGWSSVVLGACLLLTAVLVAQEQAGRVLVLWATITVASATVLLVWPGSTVVKAVAGLVIAPTLGLAVGFALIFMSRSGEVRASGDRVGSSDSDGCS